MNRVYLVHFLWGGSKSAPPALINESNKLNQSNKSSSRFLLPPFHNDFFVVDLHADSLLWKRNLLRRHTYGHVDLPRLLEGDMAFQVFAVVTKFPKGLSESPTATKIDLIKIRSYLQGWPVKTRTDLFARAEYQVKKLRYFIKNSHGRLIHIRNRDDLDYWMVARRSGKKVVGTFLALEGVHALEGRLERLDWLYEKGFRMIGLSHFHDNEAAGSAHGAMKGGLTPFGIEVVRKIEQLGMILDLAHASRRTVSDVMRIATRPMIFSHTGVCGTCNDGRNIDDETIREIAHNGGLIGIGFFKKATGGKEISHIVKAISHVVSLVGVNHVAFGSDFDGAVATPFDSAHIYLLIDALYDAGFSRVEVGQMAGLNALNLFHKVLAAPRT